MSIEDYHFSFIDRYFKETSLVEHHISSCDNFYDVSIPKIFKDKNPIRYYGIMDEKTREYKYSARLYLGGKKGDKIYYGKPMIYYWDRTTKLEIGSYCSIAAEVVILLGGNHRADWVTTYPFREFSGFWVEAADISGHPVTKGNITIGSDVWIGNGSIVLSGVSVGHGAVIAARSVVNKDVPPYAIVAGSPARVVNYRFEAEVVSALLKLRWWDWPEETVRKNMNFLQNSPTEDGINELLREVNG
jgi:acetyltransferase-like isoleucine patch superfamily enzyme